MGKLFATNETVFMRDYGLATVTGYARGDHAGQVAEISANEAPQFYLVRFEGGKATVPLATADDILRPLISKSEALEFLEILREKEVPVPDENALIAQSKRITGEGSAKEHAEFLRCLYSLNKEKHIHRAAIFLYEGLVLSELALVLGESREAIQTEMRKLHWQ